MLAVVAAFALTPAIPPEPIEPPMTWIVSGPSGTVYETTGQFATRPGMAGHREAEVPR